MGRGSYIPREAYATRQLPRWTYVSVHMGSMIEIVANLPDELDVLRETAAGPDDAPYQFDPNGEHVERSASHILALRVRVEHEETRIKLPQDKSLPYQHAALDDLPATRTRSPRPLLETFLPPADCRHD
jgi:transcriptional regulator